jgi:hypothetical protein
MTQPRPGGGRRSRIVIDVERMQAEARARKGRRLGRAGRYLSVTGLVVIVVVLVLLVGGFLWWRSFERSPAYSLALLVDAAQRGDNQTVESLTSANEINQGFIPQVMDKLPGVNPPVSPQARVQLSAALPQFLQHAPVRDEMAQELKSLSKGHTSFLLTAFGVRSAADVKEQGDKATVAFKEGDRPVELTMARDGERWRVVGVKDDRLAGDIATRLASSVPTSSQPPVPQPPPRRHAGR